MAVTKTSAPDYNDYVPSNQEMHLDKIERKVKNGKYASGQQFRADCQKIADNAAVYNAPGNGKFGGPGVVQNASSGMINIFLPSCWNSGHAVDGKGPYD